MIYNEAQWEIIKKASPHYETARHDYIRNAPRWLTEQVMNTYEAATGNHLSNRDINCAVCVLRIYQTIGKTFFADLKEREGQTTNIEIIDDDTRIENKKGNGKSKTGNKKKKE